MTKSINNMSDDAFFAAMSARGLDAKDLAKNNNKPPKPVKESPRETKR